MEWKATINGYEHQSDGLNARVFTSPTKSATWSFSYRNESGKWIDGGYGTAPTPDEAMDACCDRIIDITAKDV